MRVSVQRFTLLCGLIFIGTLPSVSAQSKVVDLSSIPDSHSNVLELAPFPDSQTKRMTVDDVIKMSKARVSDHVIIEQLKKEGQYFNLTNDQLLQLKTAHVSKQVIQVMIDPYPIRDSRPASAEKSPPASSEKSPPASSEKSPPASSEKSPPASSEKVARPGFTWEGYHPCMQGCAQTYKDCRANADAKVPAEGHACYVQLGECNDKCQP
jgi:hypothetical protein